jgi:hypothetical protein
MVPTFARADAAGTHAHDVTAVRNAAHRFVDAVTAGRPETLCRLLRGQARVYPACDHGRDIGPLLNLAIDGRSDIRLVRVRKTRAIAHIPSPATHRCKRKSWKHPQVVVLRKLCGGTWRVVELRLAEARCG